MNRAPGLFVEEVEAYYAIRIDVRMHGYRMGSVLNEDDFGSFCMPEKVS